MLINLEKIDKTNRTSERITLIHTLLTTKKVL